MHVVWSEIPCGVCPSGNDVEGNSGWIDNPKDLACYQKVYQPAIPVSQDQKF